MLYNMYYSLNWPIVLWHQCCRMRNWEATHDKWNSFHDFRSWWPSISHKCRNAFCSIDWIPQSTNLVTRLQYPDLEPHYLWKVDFMEFSGKYLDLKQESTIFLLQQLVFLPWKFIQISLQTDSIGYIISQLNTHIKFEVNLPKRMQHD